MIRSLPLVRRTLLLSVCGLFLFSGRLFAGNPLLMPSEAPYGAPRFDRIHAADIMPAIEEGIRAYKAGIAKIRALDPRRRLSKTSSCRSTVPTACWTFRAQCWVT